MLVSRLPAKSVVMRVLAFVLFSFWSGFPIKLGSLREVKARFFATSKAGVTMISIDKVSGGGTRLNASH